METLPHTREFDVAVVGHGIAGLALALSLCRCGLKVAVVGKSRRKRQLFGEHLPPIGCAALKRLGVWEQIETSLHLRSYATRGSWADRQLEEDYVFSPYNSFGLNLCRHTFELTLQQLAKEAGCVFLSGNPIMCERTETGWLFVVAMHGGGKQVFGATAAVDATGQSSWLARQLGMARIIDDRMFAVCRGGASIPVDSDPGVLVETTENGWWYSIVCPGNRIATMFFTDRPTLDAASGNSNQVFERELACAPHTLQRTQDCVWEPTLVRSVEIGMLECRADSNFLAIGDASCSFDPLSSLGICKAIDSALWATEAIQSASSSGYKIFRNRIEDYYQVHCDYRTQFYDAAAHYWHSSFWNNRSHANLIYRTA